MEKMSTVLEYLRAIHFKNPKFMSKKLKMATEAVENHDSASAQQVCLMSMPTEVLDGICENLEIKQLLNVVQLCRRLYDVATVHIYKEVHFQDCNCDACAQSWYASRYTRIHDLDKFMEILEPGSSSNKLLRLLLRFATKPGPKFSSRYQAVNRPSNVLHMSCSSWDFEAPLSNYITALDLDCSTYKRRVRALCDPTTGMFVTLLQMPRLAQLRVNGIISWSTFLGSKKSPANIKMSNVQRLIFVNCHIRWEAIEELLIWIKQLTLFEIFHAKDSRNEAEPSTLERALGHHKARLEKLLLRFHLRTEFESRSVLNTKAFPSLKLLHIPLCYIISTKSQDSFEDAGSVLNNLPSTITDLKFDITGRQIAKYQHFQSDAWRYPYSSAPLCELELLIGRFVHGQMHAVLLQLLNCKNINTPKLKRVRFHLYDMSEPAVKLLNKDVRVQECTKALVCKGVEVELMNSERRDIELFVADYPHFSARGELILLNVFVRATSNSGSTQRVLGEFSNFMSE